jgi:hypothetical protein
MAAAPAVAAIGAAELLVLLVAEGDAATPAIACGNVNKGFVNKFHDGVLRLNLGHSEPKIKFTNKKAPTGRGFVSVEVTLSK